MHSLHGCGMYMYAPQNKNKPALPFQEVRTHPNNHSVKQSILHLNEISHQRARTQHYNQPVT